LSVGEHGRLSNVLTNMVGVANAKLRDRWLWLVSRLCGGWVRHRDG